jgi:hypothetical protein
MKEEEISSAGNLVLEHSMENLDRPVIHLELLRPKVYQSPYQEDQLVKRKKKEGGSEHPTIRNSPR